MRVLVWCLVGALVACGKSARNGDHPAVGGSGPMGGAGGSTAATSGKGGTGTGGSDGGSDGGQVSAGGSSGDAGSATGGTGGTDMGGQSNGGSGADAGNGGGGAPVSGSAGVGGSAGDAEAGSSGSAGAPALECSGEYDACGCGCCGGATPKPACYYPDRGESLEAIKSDDQAVAMSPSCETAGCGLGTHYACCLTPEPGPGATLYEASGGQPAEDIWRVSIYRTGRDERCQYVHIARGDGPGPGRYEFPIALPDGWIVEGLTDVACVDKNSADASKFRTAIGGLGSISFVAVGGECTLDYDFTLFFASTSGEADAVRFVARGVPSPDVPECG